MDSWYRFYWWMVDDNQMGVLGKALNRFVRKYVKKHLDKVLPEYYASHPVECGINKNEKRERPLICSLTSFPARIDEIWLSIETIFRQTVKADEIILWLSTEQFPTHELPESIRHCIERGLTVRWVDDDLRSHKKYYYVLQEYQNADIVLLDDDLYYPDGLLENLLTMAKRHLNSICATRIHKMTYQQDILNPYRNWKHNYNPKKEKSSKDYFFTSGAGTLVPAGIMPADTFNTDVFKDICFYADDVWLNFQAKKASINVYTNDVYDKDEISIGTSQKVKLVQSNVLSGGNDKQIKAVKDYLQL